MRVQLWRPTAVEPAPLEEWDPAPEILARLESARTVGDQDQAVALARMLLTHPWYGPVMQAAVASEIAAAAAARIPT